LLPVPRQLSFYVIFYGLGLGRKFWKVEVDSMRVDRMMTILVTLLRRGRIQAKELSELLDVSPRTIYRDIEAINQAGIPIIAWQGGGGGFEIAEGYRLDGGVFSSHELAAIVTALDSIGAAVPDKKMAALADKLKSVVPQGQLQAFNLESQQLFIDFSPWSMDSKLRETVKLIRQAITQCRMISFTYRKPQGETSRRQVEAHTLVLKGQNWYLYGYCTQRRDFRLFRLSRIAEIACLAQTFERLDIDVRSLTWSDDFLSIGGIELTLRFSAEAWRVAMDWFGNEQSSVDAAGFATVTFTMPESNWLYGFILSYGDGVEVLTPEHLRKKIASLAVNISRIYQN
jgi:predicted DNA-binding transcriptional regulator YafY